MELYKKVEAVPIPKEKSKTKISSSLELAEEFEKEIWMMTTLEEESRLPPPEKKKLRNPIVQIVKKNNMRQMVSQQQEIKARGRWGLDSLQLSL